MKIVRAATLLGALLSVLIPFGSTERAAAEVPVLAHPESPKHFDRERGGRERDENERDERGKNDRDERERGGRERGHRVSKPFLHPAGGDQLNRTKEETTLFAPTQSTSPGALTPSGVLTGFDGIDQSASFADPPDGALAVSNGYIVQVVNTALSVWTKTYDPTGRLSALTQVVSAADLNAFLGTNANCHTGTNSLFGLVSDPSVDYDVTHDRFTLSMISFDQSLFTSSLCVAVTQTGDPTGNWFVYAFPISPQRSLLDFPRAVVGVDGLFYVTGNLFVCCDAAGQPTFDHARVYAFKTGDMYAGGNTSPRIVVVGNDPQTAMPADSLTPARAVGVSGMYFVSANNPQSPRTGSLITLWKWVDPFGTNVFTQQGSVAVSSYTQPPRALQLGGLPAGVTSCMQPAANCIETNDARNLTAYWSTNTVWAAHHIGCTQGGTPVACVQWYQFGNLDGVPTLLQDGTVDDPTNPGRHRYFPSLAVDLNGNVALAYAYSSATEYPGVAFTTLTPWGAQGSEAVLKAGVATYLSTRYGDYFSSAVDPHDNLSIWNMQEYAKAATTWGTWISVIQIGATPVPPALSVTPGSQDFGTVPAGSSADRTFVVKNTGGGTLTGTASVAAPFSIISGGSFSLPLGASQSVVVRFAPTTPGVFSANVTFASNGGGITVAVTGLAAGVSAIAPNSVDLASPPATFTITGNGFANVGFGLPIVNFMRGTTLIAQARATGLVGSTTLTVPYPTQATAITPNMPGLSVGPVVAQVWQQTSATPPFTLLGSAAITVVDTRGVSGITPNPVDLASPPASFTVTGGGFANIGFGLPMVNFVRNGTMIAQARATAVAGNTSMTVPFPTQATAITPNMPGLSAGPVQVQVWQQTSSTPTFSLIGSVALTVNDTRPAPSVSGITPNPIDLASPPAAFTMTGTGFADLGFGLPVVNFVRGTTLIAQARATGLTGSTTLTVPFPTQATAITPNMPGLSAGPVQAQVWQQTSSMPTFSLIGSVTLTVNDTRPAPTVSGITPNPIDLASPPAAFTMTGTGFANFGFGLPVVNFVRGSTLIAQARATGLTSTTLTVPFPTQATAITPNMPGLSAGQVQAQVWQQTSSTPTFSLAGSATLTVNDSRPGATVSGIAPNPIDLATPPASFTVTGTGFADLGFGLPVVNFMRGSTLIAQARATGLTGGTTLTVPFPTQATAITPNMPGLSAGPVQAQVWQQTGTSTFTLAGSAALTVNDTRGVGAITPNPIELATPPAAFTITGNGFADLGFGLPVVNFMGGSTLLAQARATALTGSTTLTVPFPTQATAITPNMPGLSAGSVQAQVWQQTGSGSFSLVTTVALTVTDTRRVDGIAPASINLAAPPATFTITGIGFSDLGYGLPVINFMRGTTLLGQARATALSGGTALTVPFPTQATAITPNLPGLSAGSVQAQVWRQATPGSFTLIGSANLTVTGP